MSGGYDEDATLELVFNSAPRPPGSAGRRNLGALFRGVLEYRWVESESSHWPWNRGDYGFCWWR